MNIDCHGCLYRLGLKFTIGQEYHRDAGVSHTPEWGRPLLYASRNIPFDKTLSSSPGRLKWGQMRRGGVESEAL